MDVFLRQQWYDSRLRFDNKTSSITLLELGQSTIEKVWIPDTYFVNEKDADIHEVTVPNRLMHIFSNGTVKYSIRYKYITLYCSSVWNISKEFELSNYSLLIEGRKIQRMMQTLISFQTPTGGGAFKYVRCSDLASV